MEGETCEDNKEHRQRGDTEDKLRVKSPGLRTLSDSSISTMADKNLDALTPSISDVLAHETGQHAKRRKSVGSSDALNPPPMFTDGLTQTTVLSSSRSHSLSEEDKHEQQLQTFLDTQNLMQSNEASMSNLPNSASSPASHRSNSPKASTTSTLRNPPKQIDEDDKSIPIYFRPYTGIGIPGLLLYNAELQKQIDEASIHGRNVQNPTHGTKSSIEEPNIPHQPTKTLLRGPQTLKENMSGIGTQATESQQINQILNIIHNNLSTDSQLSSWQIDGRFGKPTGIKSAGIKSVIKSKSPTIQPKEAADTTSSPWRDFEPFDFPEEDEAKYDLNFHDPSTEGIESIAYDNKRAIASKGLTGKGWPPASISSKGKAKPARPERTKKVLLCGHCGKQGHELKACVGPTINGEIPGCPIHNRSTHSFEECDAFKKFDDQPNTQNYMCWIYLCEGRHKIPPIKTSMSRDDLATRTAKARRGKKNCFPLTAQEAQEIQEKRPGYEARYPYRLVDVMTLPGWIECLIEEEFRMADKRNNPDQNRNYWLNK